MKFERIYSPIEKAMKVRLDNRRASKRYRQRHPERVPTSAVRAIYRARWKQRHPTADQTKAKERVCNMKSHYLAQLLRQSRRPVTAATLSHKRAELQAHRTRKVFRTFYATSTIGH